MSFCFILARVSFRHHENHIEKDLVSTRQEAVQFYNDIVPTIAIDETAYMLLKPICEQLGLD